jgi:hypothetical protein
VEKYTVTECKLFPNSCFIGGVHCAGLSDFSVYSAARRHFSLPIHAVFIVQVYQTSQYVVSHGSIFLGKGRRSFAGNSDGKMNVQSACALNTPYIFLALLYYYTFKSIVAKRITLQMSHCVESDNICQCISLNIFTTKAVSIHTRMKAVQLIELCSLSYIIFRMSCFFFQKKIYS